MRRLRQGAMGGCISCGLLMHSTCVQPSQDGTPLPCPACSSMGASPSVGDAYPDELEVGAPRRRLKTVTPRDPDGLSPPAEPRTFLTDGEAKARGFRDGMAWYEEAISPSLKGTEAIKTEAAA